MGLARQLLAVVASGDRTEALGGVEVPTLVIHGDVDPLIDVSGEGDGSGDSRRAPGRHRGHGP